MPRRFARAGVRRGLRSGQRASGSTPGSALVGSFGGGRFFDYTAYGDTINIAARLEAANKQLGTRICVSGSVVERIPDFRGRPVGNVILRGRSEALPAHEPLTAERHADALTAAYLDAFAKAEACDPTALSAFAALLGRDSGDGLVSFPSETAARRCHRRLGRTRMTMRRHRATRPGAGPHGVSQ